jgi:anti-sigma-K factor RskA
MSDGAHVVDSLPAYALGSLEEPEARQVAEHLATCEACRSELAEFENLTSQLALTVPDAAPSANVRRQIMDRARHPQRAVHSNEPSRPRPWRRRLAWQFVSLVLVTVLALSNVLLWQRLTALEAQPGPDAMRAIDLHNTGLAPEASGYVLIGADGQNGSVVVDRLPQLAEDQAYQVWLMRAGQSTSGAVFVVDETGYRGARIVAPDSLLTYESVQITIEPAAGSPVPTGQPVLAAVLNNL